MHDEFLKRVSQILSVDHVIQEPFDVLQKSRDIIPDTQTALAYAYPGSTDEVQAIVGLANEFQVPLWPVGRGRNWGYGGASPAEKDCLVLSLERMNQIIEVNVELAYAIIEPGVSFRDLHEYLVSRSIPLWIDCTDGPPDGSVVGNALERGIGETDYGDHFGNICGLEVVLPNASILQTGGGPINKHKSWNTYKWGVGPYIEGLFSQSNFGIVTKMGVWLRPRPEKFVSCVFELHRPQDFCQLIDGLKYLQLHGILQSKVHLINETATIAVAMEDYQNPDETLRGYRIPSWSFAAGVYGTDDHVRASIKAIQKTIGHIGKLEFVGSKKLAVIGMLSRVLRRWEGKTRLRGLSNWICRFVIGKPLPILEILPHVHAIEQGFPSDYFVRHAYLKSKTKKPSGIDVDPVRDGCGLVWLGPMVPLTGQDVSAFLKVVEPLFKKYGFDFYVALMVGNPRTAIVLLSVFYDKSDAQETKKASDIYLELGRITQEYGYQQYRTSTMYMNQVLNSAPEFRDFCKTLKRSIDPKNIMAPGKYGI